MNNYQWLIPFVAIATVIGIRWLQTNDCNTTIYRIKKKYWYAGLEVVILAAVVTIALR